jgi:predicted metalloendopeptidase
VLLEKLKAVFLSDLEAAEWMDAATREEALAKAREMRMNLGGPRSYKMFKYRVSSGAPHCTCFTSTKVQILTETARDKMFKYRVCPLMLLTVLAVLVQKYNYSQKRRAQ